MSKQYLPRSCVTALWLGLGVFGSMSIFILMADYAAIFHIIEPKDGLLSLIFFNVLIPFYLLTWHKWRKVTFAKKDFIKHAESLGVKFASTGAAYKWNILLGIGRQTFMNGFWDSIGVAAKVDAPAFTYWPGMFLTTDWLLNRYTPESAKRFMWVAKNLEDADRIDLIALIKCPCEFNVEIRFAGDKEIRFEWDEEKYKVPQTNCAEVDALLKNLFANVNQFYGKLAANKDCLRLTILGHSFDGGRLEERIIEGFEIFQKLNDALKDKFPHGDWKDWKIVWNAETYRFDLKPKADAISPVEISSRTWKKAFSSLLACLGGLFLFAAVYIVLNGLFTGISVKMAPVLVLIAGGFGILYGASTLWNRWRMPLGIFLAVIGWLFMSTVFKAGWENLVLGILMLVPGVSLIIYQALISKRHADSNSNSNKVSAP